MVLAAFLERFPPCTRVVPAEVALIERYRDLLPEPLIELWSRVGLGPYGGGLLHIIDPDTYKELLYGWLMYEEEDPSRLPIALSAFGTLFYYRRLTNEDEDVAYIDIHHRQSDVCAWSLVEFFNAYLLDEAVIENGLWADLYKAAVAKLGAPDREEIFFFEPTLALGGIRDVEHVNKGSAPVHIDLLLQLALQ